MIEPLSAGRFAIYYSPHPDDERWRAGCLWLGRCAAQQRVLQQLDIVDFDRALQQRLTAAPRRYGWHATIKAPFRLAHGVTPADLLARLRTLAASMQPFDMPTLQVRQLDDFLALVPDPLAYETANIHDLAQRCVIELQPLAAPLSDAELARRRKAGLTPQEDALLTRWGYPYVLEHYRFHMSLTGSLKHISDAALRTLERAAITYFHGLPAGRFDSLALFHEPAPGADFVLLDHVRMGI
jgi:hypothetical protein